MTNTGRVIQANGLSHFSADASQDPKSDIANDVLAPCAHAESARIHVPTL